MKLGDRVRIAPDASPTLETIYATIVALPCDEKMGIVLLDARLGHDLDCEYEEDVHDLVRQFKRLNIVFDEATLRANAIPHDKKRFWWVESEDMTVVTKPAYGTVNRSYDPMAWVPGLYHCAGGCGDINNHATARSFINGRYFCYSCRNVWNKNA